MGGTIGMCYYEGHGSQDFDAREISTLHKLPCFQHYTGTRW